MQPKGRGEHILYSMGASPLGQLMVARTRLGLCAVALADTEGALFAELQGRYPEAQLEAAPEALAAERDCVLGGLDGVDDLYSLPWDLERTPFQDEAWRVLQRIPRGETWTYGQLATHLGCPGGSIAAGQACARNPLALVIPCHRVLARGGHPHQYRWGLERKIRLLAMERTGDRGAAASGRAVQIELF